MCLGGELPLLLLPEPAIRCGSGCRLLRPGCGLPDSVVSSSLLTPRHSSGLLGQPAEGSHTKAWLSPLHATRFVPGTGGAARASGGVTQPRLQAGWAVGLLILLKTPEEASLVLEGWGDRKGGKERVGETPYPFRSTASPQDLRGPHPGEHQGRAQVPCSSYKGIE